MHKNINYLPLILSFILVNTAGLLLRYFQLNTYIIILGFRFHIALILPFVLCYSSLSKSEIKNYFVHPKFRGWFQILILTIIPLVLILTAGYFAFKLDLSDPEYFYEFGLSSVIDFPVYLLWNFPQLAALFIIIRYFTGEKKVFIKSLLFIVILFSFEFIPLEKQGIKYFSIISFLFSAAIASLLVSKFKSIYLFAIAVFTLLWLNFLSFGCDSQLITNILFARQYNSWEGFFAIDKKISQFILPAQLFLTFLLMVIRSVFISETKE